MTRRSTRLFRAGREATAPSSDFSAGSNIFGGLLSLAGLIALLFGVPALLLASHATPTMEQLTRVLTHPGSWRGSLGRPLGDNAIVKIVALVAWATWAWLVLCVGVEVIARARGLPPTRLPASRYGQSLAAFLVGASIALPSTVGASQPVRFQGAGRTVAVAVMGTNPAPAMVTSGEGGAPQTEQANAPRTYVVEPGDTLWSIASRELGSPLSWRELAQLNMGREQPDGRELTDAHWIFPGWVLLLPSVPGPPVNGTGTVGAEGSTDSAPVPTVPAPTGSASPRPVADPSQTPSRAGRSAALAKPLSPMGSESSIIELRPVDRWRDSVSSQAGRGVTTTELGSHRPRHQEGRVPIAPIGYGILGAGVIGVIDRMRRAQQRHRKFGLRIALPDDDLRELERGLRLGADSESIEWIDLGQRLLSRNALPGPDRTAPPSIFAVRLRADAVEVLLDPAWFGARPPEPFALSTDGESWILPKSRELLERMRSDPRVAGAEAPLPALATLGTDELGLVLLDVERAGSLAISGREAGALAEAMAIEMACSRWSDQVDMVIVGMAEQVGGLERVTRAASVASVIEKLGRRVRERKELLQIVRRATNFDSRWLDGGDAWDLCVVFCMPTSATAEPEAVEELVRLAGDGSYGLVVVCAADAPGARTRVHVDGGPLSLELERGSSEAVLSRFPVWPQRVDDGVAEGVGSLVEIATRLDGVSPEEPPYDELQMEVREEPPPTSTSTSEPNTSEIEVRVMGPIEILGAAQFTRAWAMELVVYLAMHRDGAGVPTDKWEAALWPDRLVAPASLHSTASAARRALGLSKAGEDHLPRSHGKLALGPGVTTDWEKISSLSHSSNREDWRRALELIRGRPFDGLRAPDWPLLEGITATIEAVVVDLAGRFCESCLQGDDPAGAEWGARQGLKVSSFDERLYRILLRTADAAGNPAGIEAVMTELTALVGDVEPFDAVHPETLELYRALSRRPFAHCMRR